jgi:hypothetical protein
MFKSEKEGLIRLGVLFGVVAVFVLSILVRKAIPPEWFGVSIFIIQSLWLTPSLSKGYHAMFKKEDSWTRFIPIWNTVRLFSQPVAIICYILLIPMALLLLFLLLSYIAPEVTTTLASAIVGDLKGRVASYFIIQWILLLLVIEMVVEGIGLFSIKQDINEEYLKSFKYPVKSFEYIDYIFVFFPLARIYSLFNMDTRLRKINYVGNQEYLDLKEYEIKGME